MPRCCGGASCSCVIDNGAHIQIIGVGSPADPFVISGDIALTVADNSVFDLALTGLGTTAVPWRLEANFASTAKLNDLPDVNAPAPTNAQVLSWDTATGQWINRAPTTAAAGTVTHDTSLAGDGSAGTPLQVAEDPARMLATTASGLGLSDTGMNSIVRRFADSTTRAAATPAPVNNALSILASNPGQIDYWNGSAWGPAGVFLLAMVGEEMYQQSGPYTGAQRVTFMVRNVDVITDSTGAFDAIPATDLAGRAGVITAIAQATAPDLASLVTPYAVVLVPVGGALRGVAYRLDDGQPLALSPVTCTVIALVY
jgi:hypothetical protein